MDELVLPVAGGVGSARLVSHDDVAGTCVAASLVVFVAPQVDVVHLLHVVDHGLHLVGRGLVGRRRHRCIGRRGSQVSLHRQHGDGVAVGGDLGAGLWVAGTLGIDQLVAEVLRYGRVERRPAVGDRLSVPEPEDLDGLGIPVITDDPLDGAAHADRLPVLGELRGGDDTRGSGRLISVYGESSESQEQC